MADNVDVTPGSGKTIATDEVADGTLGTVQVQYIKIMDGALGGTTKAAVGANGLSVTSSILATVAKQPALGTAGTASTDVISIQGIASMTPVQSDTAKIAGTTTAVNTGTMNNGTQRVALATDSPGVTALGQTTMAASLPVTIASNQTGIAVGTGTAGSAATAVATVQGIASMTPLLVSGTGTAGTAASAVTTIQGIASMTPVLTSGTGTAGTAASAVTTIQGIASMTPVQVSQATASNLNAIVAGGGTAGSAATGVVTVQGIASMTPLLATAAGDIANDAADSGNPVKVGGKAITALSAITLVTANDRVNWNGDLDGAQVVRVDATLGDLVSGNASNTDGASTQCIAAAAGSIKQYLTSVTLTNTSNTMIYVELKSGTTVKWTCPLPGPGGFTYSWPKGLPPNAAAEAWNFDPSAATTTVYCSMVAFKSLI